MTNILTPGYLRWDGTKYLTDPDIEIVGPIGPPGPQGIQGIQGPTGPTGAQGDVPGSRLLTASTGLQGGGDLTANRSFNVNPNLLLTSLNVFATGTVKSLNSTSLAVGANGASFGEIRLPSLGKINFRNFANSADLIILTTDGSNNTLIGDTTGSAGLIINFGSSSHAQFRVGASPIWDLSATSNTISVPNIQFGNTTIAPVFTQADDSINSSTAQSLTIHAQNATGTGATVGGGLILASGTGNTTGLVTLKSGSVTMLDVDTNRLQMKTGKFIDFSDAGSITFANNNYTFLSGDLSGNVIVGDAAAVNNLSVQCTSTLTLYGGSEPTLNFYGNGLVNYDSGNSQADFGFDSVPGTGATSSRIFTIHGQGGQLQSGVNNNNNGGVLILAGGLAGTGGSGTPGVMGQVQTISSAVVFKDTNSVEALRLTPAATGTTTLLVPSTTTNFNIQQANATFGTGANITIQAQNITGGSNIGGSLILQSGTGTSVSGAVSMWAGSTKRVEINGTGIGFFNVSPVARSATYTVTNGTTDRSLNVTGDTLTQGLQVLGTLINDLKLLGLIG